MRKYDDDDDELYEFDINGKLKKYIYNNINFLIN